MDRNQIIDIAIGLLAEGKTTEIPAHGISMFPVLLPNDTLIIHPYKSFNVGDIVIFKGSASLVAHRIIKIRNDQIICKGDSLVLNDSPLKKEQILGVIIGFKRKNKLISSNHWIFKTSKWIMPLTGKIPRIFIRKTALMYLKLTQH